MTFPADYRRIVAPRLLRAAQFQGVLIATGDQAFGTAYAALMREAYRLGASHLADDLRAELDEAVADWLVAAIDAALPDWEAAQALAARVAEDIARHEAKL